jgi:hypothetical protein
LVQLGVIEDQQCRLSTSLESDVLHVNGRHLHDLLTSSGATSERNLIDIRVARKRLSSLSPMSVNNINNSRWETSLLEQTSHVQNRQWCLLSCLKDNRVTTRQCRSQLPRRHLQRKVPRDNLTANTDGLFDSICKLIGTDIDGLAMVLVRVAGIVS